MIDLIKQFKDDDVDKNGYEPLNANRKLLLNTYAFLYYKFSNEKLREKILNEALVVFNETIKTIALTGKIKNGKYYEWDYAKTCAIITDAFFNAFKNYNPYPKRADRFSEFVPYFKMIARHMLQNEYKKDNRLKTISFDSGELINTISGENSEEEWINDTYGDVYAKKLIHAIINLLNAVNFQKFYSLGKKEVPQKRYEYFKLFLTGDIIALVKNSKTDDFAEFVLPAQTKLLKNMNNDFVDFVYVNSLDKYDFLNLRKLHFKTHRDLSIEILEKAKKKSPDSEIELPFEQIVYAKFTNKKAPTIHNFYIEEKRKNGKIVKGYRYFFDRFTSTEREDL